MFLDQTEQILAQKCDWTASPKMPNKEKCPKRHVILRRVVINMQNVVLVQFYRPQSHLVQTRLSVSRTRNLKQGLRPPFLSDIAGCSEAQIRDQNNFS